jgi:hypothetical protein
MQYTAASAKIFCSPPRTTPITKAYQEAAEIGFLRLRGDRGTLSPVWGPGNSGAYLQVSLTIFRLVTPKAAYCSLLDALTTPSRFSSAFSCALDS